MLRKLVVSAAIVLVVLSVPIVCQEREREDYLAILPGKECL